MIPLSASGNVGKYPLLVGFILSFLASLPPGMVNILTIQLALTESYIVAFQFALGALAAELILANICVVFVNRACKFAGVTRILQALMLIALMVLTTLSFVGSVKQEVQQANILAGNDLSPFIYGFLTMSINPGLVPFWIGTTTILVERKILKTNKAMIAGYLLGIGVGSVIASVTFIACGHFFFSTLAIKTQALHFIFGWVFAIMAIIYAGKLLGVSSRHVREH